ncbi:MAG: Gfo/Idh/MocA family oxidoreductase [Ruminococcaceae bacterium]|nr:Gfo/Idh/MocA family oxidoreductase [Oscillospiraceae bacterium]
MKPVKIAIIGCGTIANSAHGPSYAKNPKAKIAYCVYIIPERAKALAEKYGDAETQVLTDYHDFLQDQSVELVSVCVPNYLHAPISIDCLNAGKHVLCEKPAAVNYAEVLRMKEAADKNQRILNIGVVNRFNTAVNKVRDLIQAGELGSLYHIYCSFRAHRSIPGLGGQFTTKAMAGGGVLIDWGVHFIDLICYCINAPAVQSVSGAAYSKLGTDMEDYVYTGMWAGPPDYSGTYDVEDFVTGFVRTAGPSITLNGAWAQNLNERAMFIEFLGDKAGIKLQYGGQFTLFSTKDDMLTETKCDMNMADMFYDEIDAFIECGRQGKKIRSNVDEVLVTAQIMDGLYQSAESGQEVVFS